MNASRILVAGIGNIFMGDDAFGVETIRQLLQHDLPDGVQATDFGIRSYDLAFAISGGYDAVILVDATQRGGAAGTVYLIEPDLSSLDANAEITNGHGLNAASAMQMAASFKKADTTFPAHLYLVGCEPGVLEREDGEFLLSDAVRDAVPRAVTMIESLLGDLRNGTHDVLRDGMTQAATTGG